MTAFALPQPSTLTAATGNFSLLPDRHTRSAATSAGRLTATIEIRRAGSAWAEQVFDRLKYLRALTPHTPGVGRPMSAIDIQDAIEFLRAGMRPATPPPWIGRLESGGLQLSWIRGDLEIEMVFDSARGEREIAVIGAGIETVAVGRQAEALFARVVDGLA